MMERVLIAQADVPPTPRAPDLGQMASGSPARAVALAVVAFILGRILMRWDVRGSPPRLRGRRRGPVGGPERGDLARRHFDLAGQAAR